MKPLLFLLPLIGVLAQVAQRPSEVGKEEAPHQVPLFKKKPDQPKKTDLRSMHGIVRDSNGGTVPTALVTIKDKSTGKSRSRTTDPDGKFMFDELVKTRDYELTAVHADTRATPRTVSSYNTAAKPYIELELSPSKGTEKAEAKQ